MRLKSFVTSTLILLAGICRTADAEDADLPSVHTVVCVTVCANSTGPVADSHPKPQYPVSDINWAGTYVEGYVLLHYTILPDGHVSDIAVLELVGPKNFEDSTLDTVKDWTYKPATLDGKPVATCRTLLATFRVPSAVPGGRPRINHLYDMAADQIKDSKFDDAMATLNEAQATPKLNFYERGMVANLQSMLLMQKGDYIEARRLSQLATDHGADELQPAVLRRLLDTRIRASIGMGDLVDALNSLDRLKRTTGFEADSPVVKLVEGARARADSAPVFATMGKIPESGDKGDAVVISLYRRNFAFADISGSLDRFVLSCKQQAVESKISATAEWHVPKSWSDCHVLVRGAPGTTFKLAQETE